MLSFNSNASVEALKKEKRRNLIAVSGMDQKRNLEKKKADKQIEPDPIINNRQENSKSAAAISLAVKTAEFHLIFSFFREFS